MRIFYTALVMVSLMWNAQAYEGESIVLDPATGNYIITYMGDEDKLMQTTFVPATKIMPSVHSAFRLDKDFVVTYRYSISNASTSQNPIDGFMVDDVVNPILGELPFPHEATGADWLKPYHDAIKANIATPGWSAGIARDASYGLKRIHWGVLTSNPAYLGKPIQAGQTLSGFGFKSIDLPGVGESKLDGGFAIFGYPDDGPDEDSPIYEPIMKLRKNNFVVRPAAVPTISLPAVFDAAVVLDRIREHVATWPSKQLVDATFAAQLDRYLLSAAEAYRHNQPKAGKEHIETLREMLKRAHKDLEHDDDEAQEGKHGDKHSEHHPITQALPIDRLAARVLDFDLKYMQHRMKVEDKSTH